MAPQYEMEKGENFPEQNWLEGLQLIQPKRKIFLCLLNDKLNFGLTTTISLNRIQDGRGHTAAVLRGLLWCDGTRPSRDLCGEDGLWHRVLHSIRDSIQGGISFGAARSFETPINTILYCIIYYTCTVSLRNAKE